MSKIRYLLIICVVSFHELPEKWRCVFAVSTALTARHYSGLRSTRIATARILANKNGTEKLHDTMCELGHRERQGKGRQLLGAVAGNEQRILKILFVTREYANFSPLPNATHITPANVYYDDIKF